jgi:hypothetical protein
MVIDVFSETHSEIEALDRNIFVVKNELTNLTALMLSK